MTQFLDPPDPDPVWRQPLPHPLRTEPVPVIRPQRPPVEPWPLPPLVVPEPGEPPPPAPVVPVPPQAPRRDG